MFAGLVQQGVGFVRGNLLEPAYKIANLFVVPLFGLFFGDRMF